MTVNPSSPRFVYFRATPADMLANPPLASSLQTLETCYFLIALGHYPQALVACATAVESAIKAKMKIKPEQEVTLDQLIKMAQQASPTLRLFSGDKLYTFRKKRNSIIHFGFSPNDDQVCATILLDAGLPFISQCFRQLFDFCLDWRDVNPAKSNFQDLSEEESSKAGLFPEVAHHQRIAGDVYRMSKDIRGLEFIYCFRSLAHFLRLGMKEAFMTAAEYEQLNDFDASSLKWDREESLRGRIESLYGACWTFDCPVCRGVDKLVAEIDEGCLARGSIELQRCYCVQCDFSVPSGSPNLTQRLLATLVDAAKAAILKDYGIKV